MKQDLIARRKFIKQAGQFGLFLPVYDALRPLAYAQTVVRRPLANPAGGGNCVSSLCVVNDDIQSITGTATPNITFDVGSGSNRVLFAVLYTDFEAGVTAVVYGIQAMTLVNTFNGRGFVYRLFAPATGSNTLTFTITGGTGRVLLGAVALIGAHQSTAGNNDEGEGTGTAITTPAVTSGITEMVLDFVQFGVDNPAQTLAPGSGQTELFQLAAVDQSAGACSWKQGAASVSTAWTASASVVWKTISVGVVPV